MKIRTGTLANLKAKQEKFACLTSYDALTSQIFDEAGIEVILVGDSAGNVVLGYETTVPVTIDQMVHFGKAVSQAAKSALVVIDMPFGSYEISSSQALDSAIRIMKETSADAVKLEGARPESIKALVDAGIPVMGHLGFTPQSVNQLSGFKVQGRGSDAEKLLAQAKALESAGAFAIVLEMIPAGLAAEITRALEIPTIGIGAGAECDGQILVWTDFAGLSDRSPKFAKKYLELRSSLADAATIYRDEVKSGSFPKTEHSFD
ncbi:MAG: 3-methyl-2-oxobutanoate hydroxymethyltransferase [Actinobacteria bacterium]|nr:3-methyl-2-oxobutanoate hydroxymethyltransferase [Actinomycetota bacterium]